MTSRQIVLGKLYTRQSYDTCEYLKWKLCACGWSGSRDGAVVRALAFHQCGPGSIRGLDVICGLSLLLVLFSAPRGFSPGTPVFPSPQKPTFLNSNSIWNARAFNTWALAREIGQPLPTLSSLNKIDLIWFDFFGRKSWLMLDAHDSLKFILVQNVGMHTIHVSPCKINVNIKGKCFRHAPSFTLTPRNTSRKDPTEKHKVNSQNGHREEQKSLQ